MLRKPSALKSVLRKRTPLTARRLLLCSLGLLPLLVWAGPPAPASRVVEVIAHESVPGEYLDRDHLRALYTLRTWVWPNGEPVTLFVLDDQDPLHRAFCQEILGTYPYILRSVWDRVLFSGVGVVPVRVASEKDMRERVALTPGAVGYRRPTLAGGDE